MKNKKWDEVTIGNFKREILEKIQGFMQTLDKELKIDLHKIGNLFPPNEEFKTYNPIDFAIWLEENKLGVGSSLQWIPTGKEMHFRCSSLTN